MGSPVEEHCRERRALDSEMYCHVGEDTRECADAEARVIGDRDVMLATCCVVRRMWLPVSRVTAYP